MKNNTYSREHLLYLRNLKRKSVTEMCIRDSDKHISNTKYFCLLIALFSL